MARGVTKRDGPSFLPVWVWGRRSRRSACWPTRWPGPAEVRWPSHGPSSGRPERRSSWSAGRCEPCPASQSTRSLPPSLVSVNSEIIPHFVSDTSLWYITGLTACNLRQQKQCQFFRCQKISDCSSGDENKTRLLSSLKQCVVFFSFFYCRQNKPNNKCCSVCVGDSPLTLPLALLILLTTSASRTFSSTALLSFWYLGFLLISR